MSVWAEDYVLVLSKTRNDLSRNQAVINNITQRTVKLIDETHMIWTLQGQGHELELIKRRK